MENTETEIAGILLGEIKSAEGVGAKTLAIENYATFARACRDMAEPGQWESLGKSEPELATDAPTLTKTQRSNLHHALRTVAPGGQITGIQFGVAVALMETPEADIEAGTASAGWPEEPPADLLPMDPFEALRDGQAAETGTFYHQRFSDGEEVFGYAGPASAIGHPASPGRIAHSFEKALEVITRAKVAMARHSWKHSDSVYADGQLYLGDRHAPWAPSVADLKAKDWIILDRTAGEPQAQPSPASSEGVVPLSEVGTVAHELAGQIASGVERSNAEGAGTVTAPAAFDLKMTVAMVQEPDPLSWDEVDAWAKSRQEPVGDSPVTYTFGEAVNAMAQGKRARPVTWDEQSYMKKSSSGILATFMGGAYHGPRDPSISEIIGDWLVL